MPLFKRLLHGSLSARLVLTIGIPASLFLLVVMAWVGLREFEHTLEQTQREAQDMAQLEAVKLDRVLAEAARVPEVHAAVLESGALKTEANVQAYLTETLARHMDLLYGSCLAFEPHQFSPNKANYCPYVYRKDGKVIFSLLQPPDYNHFDWDWYKVPKKNQQGVWTEPFYDEGGGNVLMTTRTVPLFRKAVGGDPASAGEKVFWGVATIDIALDSLIARLDQIHPSRSGYAFLISRSGRFLYHPDRSKVFNSHIKELSPDLAEKIHAQPEGFLRMKDPHLGLDSWIAYASVQHGGFTLALVYPSQDVFSPARRSALELAAVALLGIVGLFGSLTFISHSVTRPIRKLADASAKIAAGDLEYPLNTGTRIREVHELTLAFGKMTRDLRLRMAQLQESSMLKARLTGELNAARRIQTSMLPREWSAHNHWPHHSDIALHAVMQPAREIGGDFYDHRFLDERRVSILIGDVSGKGVPAALFMAMTQTLFKGYSGPHVTAVDIMGRVNDALCDETYTGMFVTLVYAVLDVESGEMEVCNAGHSPPVLLSQDAAPAPLQSERHPALGLMRNYRFTSSRFMLKPGEKLFFYTDGVTEAFNPEQELFGLARLEHLLLQYGDLPVDQLTQLIMNAVRDHSDSEEISDDVTVLAIKLSDQSSAI